jgi:putative peptidoglycan lipid II flippase
VIQLPQLRTAMDYTPRIDLVDPAARQTLRLMIPRAIGLGVIQITVLVNTSLAAGLPAGSVTAYFLAFTILQIPLGVIGFPMGVVLLPSLSRAMSAHRMDDFRVLVERSLRLLLWLTLFVVTTGIALRAPITDVLFGGGVSAEVLAWTAATLGWFLLGLPAHALNVVLTRAFYSDQDTRTPVILACLSVVVNVIVSVATVSTMGLAGLALGVAVGGWFETICLSVLLDRRTEAIPARAITFGALVSLGGALIAGAVALGGWAVATSAIGDTPGRLMTLVAGGVVGLAALATYLLYSRIMGIPELPQAVRLLRAGTRRGGEA